jgi:hypothetical protein
MSYLACCSSPRLKIIVLWLLDKLFLAGETFLSLGSYVGLAAMQADHRMWDNIRVGLSLKES